MNYNKNKLKKLKIKNLNPYLLIKYHVINLKKFILMQIICYMLKLK